MIRIKIGDLPKQLNWDIFFTWPGDSFSDFVVEYFLTLDIVISYHSIAIDSLDNDVIEISEKDLTWLRLKYS